MSWLTLCTVAALALASTGETQHGQDFRDFRDMFPGLSMKDLRTDRSTMFHIYHLSINNYQ